VRDKTLIKRSKDVYIYTLLIYLTPAKSASASRLHGVPSFPGHAPAADTAPNRSDSAAGRPIGTNAARSSMTWIAYRANACARGLVIDGDFARGRTSAERGRGVWSVGGVVVAR
ncbi:hypothetical protein O988_09691, partial [Pseudogymnoascus sp. VKM F-3808]